MATSGAGGGSAAIRALYSASALSSMVSASSDFANGNSINLFTGLVLYADPGGIMSAPRPSGGLERPHQTGGERGSPRREQAVRARRPAATMELRGPFAGSKPRGLHPPGLLLHP